MKWIDPAAAFEDRYVRGLRMMALAGAGASLVAFVAARASGLPTDPHGWFAVLHALAAGPLIGAAAAAVAGQTRDARGNAKAGAWGIAMGSLGGSARALLLSRYPGLGDALFGAATGALLARASERRAEKVRTIVLSALLSLVASWTWGRLAGADWLRVWLPTWAAIPAGGAAYGFILAMGALPLHLTLDASGTAARLRVISRSLDGEPRALVERLIRSHAALLSSLDALDRFLPEESRLALRDHVDAIGIGAGEMAAKLRAMDELLAGSAASPAAPGPEDPVQGGEPLEDAAVFEEREWAIEAAARAGASRRLVASERAKVRARIERTIASLEGLRGSLVAASAAGIESGGVGRGEGAGLDSLLAAARAYGEELESAVSFAAKGGPA